MFGKKEGGALKKQLANVFSERASWRIGVFNIII